MNASDSLLPITLCLSCIGLACEPKPSSPTAAPPTTSEVGPGVPPVAKQAAAAKPADEKAPPSKCFSEGGTCLHRDAQDECVRFEEAEQFGCTDENTGCCFQ